MAQVESHAKLLLALVRSGCYRQVHAGMLHPSAPEAPLAVHANAAHTESSFSVTLLTPFDNPHRFQILNRQRVPIYSSVAILKEETK